MSFVLLDDLGIEYCFMVHFAFGLLIPTLLLASAIRMFVRCLMISDSSQKNPIVSDF